MEPTEVVSTGRPVYPDSLREAGVEGRVVVDVFVDSNGVAVPGTATVVESSNLGFNQSALDFVGAAHFRPAMRRGRPIAASVLVPIDFKIERRDATAVFLESQVDEPPLLRTDTGPAYPAGRRGAGLDVQVLTSVIVDTLGRVEPASVRIVSSPGPEFAAAARAYLLGARFRAGRLNGVKVRVRLDLPVPFSERRGT